MAHHRFPARHLCRASPTGNLFITQFSNCISTCFSGMSCPLLSHHPAESTVKPNSAWQLSTCPQHLGWKASYRANLCDQKFFPFSCIIECCKIYIAAFSKTDNVSDVLRHCWVESRHRETLCGEGGWWFAGNSSGLVPFSASKAHGQQEQCVTAPTWGRNESWGLGNSVNAASRAGSELWGAQRKGTFPPLKGTEKESKKGLPWRQTRMICLPGVQIK